MTPTFFATEDAFRGWLDANHDSAAELIVGLHKKGARRKGITRREALDAALAFGWIDGVVRSLAAEPRATACFDAQPPGYRQLMTKWVMSAKKEKTRAKRLARLIEVSARRERIDLLNSKRSHRVD